LKASDSEGAAEQEFAEEKHGREEQKQEEEAQSSSRLKERKKRHHQSKNNKKRRAISGDVEDEGEDDDDDSGAIVDLSPKNNNEALYNDLLSELQTYFDAKALQGDCLHCHYDKDIIGHSLSGRPLYTSRLITAEYLKQFIHSLGVRVSAINRGLPAPDEEEKEEEEEEVVVREVQLPKIKKKIDKNTKTKKKESKGEQSIARSRVSKKSQQQPPTPKKNPTSSVLAAAADEEKLQKNIKNKGKRLVFSKPVSEELGRPPSRVSTRIRKGLGFLSDQTSADETNRNNSSGSAKYTSPTHSSSHVHD
jgi:hypothetical protein